ncbi:hypothetical protein DDD_1476 [Nonlabens dokdonensis DSW-6]|uniref:Uncharacterized protein n=1 Tax=Nonlabens dokdonensis (strain DSM 17205 / KCTC 12402 / DSW-6) TaxID=592029 RepID=L7WCG5_NONDD|nr:hypothetical protein DDD_1476 [Nonlabens dokdonensis DSW-6]
MVSLSRKRTSKTAYFKSYISLNILSICCYRPERILKKLA